MGNWLHIGIDSTLIREQYNKILYYEFPKPPENDELYDLFIELVELDAYIMGMVSSYLKKGIIDRDKLKCDGSFLEIVSQIEHSSEELDGILTYKKELDKLIELLYT